MALSFDPNHGENAVRYEKSMRERNRLLKDQVRDRHWYLALEAQMAEAGIALQASRRLALERLAEAQETADTSFPAAELELTAPDDAETPPDVDGFTDLLAENRQRDLYAGRTLIGPHRADLHAVYATKGVAAKLCSTGEQKALLISLILANARALEQDLGAPPIVLLDEVAAHLDANRRAALYDEICALGAQAWMTGTGPDLFEELGARAQRFEVIDAENASIVRPI
jgi:DNA replication and repair protein RecF